MATQHDNKHKRIARWERKHKRDEHDRKINKVLKDRKRRRKSLRGPDQITRAASAKLTSKAYQQAVRQLWDATRKTKLVIADHGNRPGFIDRHRSHLYGLAQLAQRHAAWVRPPAAWKPRSHNADRQFCSLARHLLCAYSPPACMDSAWFEADKKLARRQQSWFIYVGGGGNIRHVSGLPLELSRRAAHLFQSAPASLDLMQGLRWAQLRALGAQPPLVEQLLATPMGTDFARDEFWLTVARFFIDHPMLDRAQVGPVVDFLHHHRHVNQPAMWVDGREVPGTPLQPNLSMRGRDPVRLLRRVRQWHDRLARGVHRQAFLTWKPSRVAGLARTEGEGYNARRFVIQELCSTRALLGEGRLMGHCVGSYDGSCHAGHTAIFAMSCNHKGSVKKLLTIEVNLRARQVVQARGRFNALPTPDALRILRVWAQQAQLAIGRWV